MNRRDSTRRQSRNSVLWRVFYGSEELVGEGTILDMHGSGCRIAGCMPVEAGMHLRLCIWPSQNPQDIVVARGLVKWAKGLQFGVALETWKGGEQNIHSLRPELETDQIQ
jgi:hypothetical protein